MKRFRQALIWTRVVIVHWIGWKRCRSLLASSAALVGALCPGALPATPVVYDTTPYWPYSSSSLGGLGPGVTTTVGETFVAPLGTSVTLNDFSFFAESYYPAGGSATLKFRAFVFDWSGPMTGKGGGAVGDPLYMSLSSFQFSPPPRPDGWVPLTASFGTSGLALTPGDQYVMGFTLSYPTDYAASQGYIEFQVVPTRGLNYPPLPAGVDGNGGAVWLSYSNNFAALNTTTWSTWGDVGDVAFVAHLTVIPEPSIVVLAPLGAVVWAVRPAGGRRPRRVCWV